MKHTFNRILSACLAVLLCVGLFAVLAAPVSAESGTCGDNVTWILENGTLTLTGSGNMYNYNNAEYNGQIYTVYEIVSKGLYTGL